MKKVSIHLLIMKKVATATSLTVIAATLLICSYFVIANYTSNFLKEIQDETFSCKDHIGKNYILGKDTLIIIDYSIINSTYTLSDGREISFNLVDKNL